MKLKRVKIEKLNQSRKVELVEAANFRRIVPASKAGHSLNVPDQIFNPSTPFATLQLFNSLQFFNFLFSTLRMSFKLSITGLLSLFGVALFAQTAVIQGTVTDADSGSPLKNASVRLEKTTVAPAETDAAGMYTLEKVPGGLRTIIVSAPGHLPQEKQLKVLRGQKVGPIDFALKRDPTESNGELPTVTLDEAEAETEGAGEVANLLHASRDVFQNISGFGWATFRFRERGYDSEHFPLFLNGVNVNDPETGMTFFGEFGGLNDVLRSRESTVGLDAADFAFAEIGGATRIDTRASVQRKQLRASFAESNRTYRHRAMLTYNTGLMPGGWAVSISGSRRWADEGYFPGTPFDGYSWFASVDKKFGHKHTLNFTALAAPTRRGRIGDTFQEMLDIAGSNSYNPLWGYQNGQKRNSQIAHNNQPMLMLRYDWTPSRSTSLTLTTFGQSGRSGMTRLEWANATNPAPDFNRRLPSSIADPAQAEAWRKLLVDNEALRQVQWDQFFEGNRHNFETIANADGTGESVTGRRSHIIVEDRRNDSRELGANLLLRQTISSRVLLNGGANYSWYRGQNFKILDDLLGGDFWLDINRFAAGDRPDLPDAPQNDLATPNNLVREGERFGYDYDENIRRAGAWAQAQFSLPRLQFFAGAEAGHTSFWRTGHYQNGIFPATSLGDSEKLDYPTWGAKAGATYKINGRNYLYANGFYGTRAPQFRDLFVAPRVRNQVFEGIETYEVRAIEGGYHLRAPYYKARLTGYLTEFIGETETYQVFFQTAGDFGTINIQNANRRHAGIEAAFEVKPILQWTFTGAASVGKYIYTNRPTLNFVVDNFDQPLIEGDTVFQKNYYVPRVPQTAATFGVKYESKKFWFAALSFNWRDNLWFDFDETRRTRAGVEGVERNTDIWNLILDQQKAPAAYTIDFFGGKSWLIQRGGKRYYLNLNVGVNNLLDNQNIILSGRDAYLNAYRDVNDVRRYSTEVQYATGLNYFISLGFRM